MRPAVTTPAPTSDEDLLRAFSTGDEQAFARFHARHHQRLVAYAWRLLGRREEAEEVCADVFSQLARGRWKEGGSARAWVFTLTHRRCLDRLRRRSRWARVVPWLSSTPDPVHTPEHALARTDRQRHLERALSGLSEDHRAVILLYYGEELSSREVADVLGCSDQQVRSRLAYARRLLRDAMPDSVEV